MVRKDKTKENKSNKTSSKDKANKAKTDNKPKITKDEAQDNFTVLIKAKTKKISPKSEGSIGFELVKDKEAILYLRLTSNSSSGNFCKTPVSLNSVIDALNKQKADTAFTSKVIKDVFQGKGSRNSNNRSFLMAVLRSKDMGLTVADKDKSMSSKLSVEFKSQSDKLLGMS
ncbi:MAG: hypothetical protein QM500_04670 [Methylococcales bacterium]